MNKSDNNSRKKRYEFAILKVELKENKDDQINIVYINGRKIETKNECSLADLLNFMGGEGFSIKHVDMSESIITYTFQRLIPNEVDQCNIHSVSELLAVKLTVGKENSPNDNILFNLLDKFFG